MPESSAEFTAKDASAVVNELRSSLGLEAETFSTTAFVGMISDEIEQYRAAGRSDADVAAIIRRTTGKDVSVEEISRNYAPPEERRQG